MAAIDPTVLQDMARLINLLGERVIQPQIPTTTINPSKSEKTPDVDMFTPTSNSAQNTQALDLFKTRLQTKFEINADRYPHQLAMINYTFSRIASPAAELIRPYIAQHSLNS